MLSVRRILSGVTRLQSGNARRGSSIATERLRNDQVKHEEVIVQLGQSSLKFNSVWLKENCRSEGSFNQTTQQRNVLYYDLSSDQTSVHKSHQDSENLYISWKDGHSSTYPLQWLIENSHPGTSAKTPKQLWCASDLDNTDVPRVAYDILVGDDEASLNELLTSILKFGIGLVDGVPASIEGTQKAVEKVCYVQETLFGRMWGFTADMARGDTAYTNIALGAHTDNTYLAIPAGIQVFHCLHHDGTGGETLLVDGFKAAEDLRSEDRSAFDLLVKERIHHQYIEPGHHVESLDSVLKVNPVSRDLEMIRYNHYDRSPIRTIPQQRLPEYYDALAHFSYLMTRMSGEYWLKLKPGTVIFVDNWRVLHGRASFTGNRKICGCYLPRDDWIGRARVARLV